MFFSREDATQVASHIEFNRPDEPYGAFHCDAPYGVMLEQVTWPTVTHYLLGKQFPAALSHGLRQSPTPEEARQIAREHQHPARIKWDVVKDQYVYWALVAKFTQHIDLEGMLMSTSDIAIVYANPYDAYYGVGPDGNGHNMLGRLLMKVRRDLSGRLRLKSISTEARRHIEMLEAAARSDQSNTEAMTYLAIAYFDAGWLDRARSLARTLVEMEPLNQPAHYILALSLYHQGNVEEAVEPLKRLTQLDPNFADYFRWLSAAYRRLDREIPATLYARRARLLEEE